MAASLDGPRLAAKSQRTDQLVVFLHGYGANGNDLIAIGKQWRNLLPGAAFVAPNAPEPCGQIPADANGSVLTMRDPGERWTGVNKARPALYAFLDAELDRHGSTTATGFGRLSAKDDARSSCRIAARAGACGILGYSGELVAPEQQDQAARAKPAARIPPIFPNSWQRGRGYPGWSTFSFGRGIGADRDSLSVASFGRSRTRDRRRRPHAWRLVLGKCFGLKQNPGARP